MKANIITALSLAAALSLPALANETTKVQTGDGQVEMKSDTSKNPFTGNTTETTETEVKNANGDTLSKRKVKIKRNKQGAMIKKSVDGEKHDPATDSSASSKYEETHQ